MQKKKKKYKKILQKNTFVYATKIIGESKIIGVYTIIPEEF